MAASDPSQTFVHLAGFGLEGKLVFKKIVQRVPVPSSAVDDFIVLIDLIEIELDLSTGRKSLRTRLSEALRADGVNPELTDVLRDAVKRLAYIVRISRHHGHGFQGIVGSDFTASRAPVLAG